MGKKLLFFVFAAFVMAACSTAPKDQELQVLSVSELLENAATLVDQEVKVEGMVIHVCQHGGARLFIEDAEEKRIKVEANELVQFDVTLEKSEIIVTGFLREIRIDEAYLQEWEAELAAEAEQIIEETDVEEGEDHMHIEDHPHMPGKDHHLSDPYVKIASYREMIAASENGYVSEYWFEATAYEIKYAQEEVIEEEVIEEEVAEEAPVAEQE